MSDLAFGLWITLAGMGVVFALLGILWGLLSIIGRIDRADAGEAAPGHVRPDAALPPLLTDEELAALTIAVLTHVRMRRQQAAPEMRTAVPGSQLWASRWLGAGRTRQTRGWQGRR